MRKLQRYIITALPEDGKLRAPKGGAICLGGEEISAGRLIPKVPFSEWVRFSFREVRESPLRVMLGGTLLLLELRQSIRDSFREFVTSQEHARETLKALRKGPLSPLLTYLVIHTGLTSEVSIDELQQARGGDPEESTYLTGCLGVEVSIFTTAEAFEGPEPVRVYPFEAGGVIPQMVGAFPPEDMATEVFFDQYLREQILPLGQEVLWGKT